jgi:CheY-like chemotaxis protein
MLNFYIPRTRRPLRKNTLEHEAARVTPATPRFRPQSMKAVAPGWAGMESAQQTIKAGTGAQARAPHRRSIAKNKGAHPSAPSGYRRMATVLLVDDDPNTLEALKELVGQEGYRVTTAADGSDALKSALADPPDVVISDCMMPRMDGIALMHAMRRSRVLAHVPLVLVSALVSLPADAKVAGFLRKPFAVTQLIDILHRVHAP